MYHPYVRPPTEEIIARIYPRKNGERTKVYPSGAALKGTVVNEVFQVFMCDTSCMNAVVRSRPPTELRCSLYLPFPPP